MRNYCVQAKEKPAVKQTAGVKDFSNALQWQCLGIELPGNTARIRPSERTEFLRRRPVFEQRYLGVGPKEIIVTCCGVV